MQKLSFYFVVSLVFAIVSCVYIAPIAMAASGSAMQAMDMGSTSENKESDCNHPMLSVCCNPSPTSLHSLAVVSSQTDYKVLKLPVTHAYVPSSTITTAPTVFSHHPPEKLLVYDLHLQLRRTVVLMI